MFKTDNNIHAKAQIKDGALVLYLPKALKPCVWRMDLEILSETSIEIDQKDNIYILATRDINGVIKSIAGFEAKDDAQEALSLTLNALMSGGSTKNTSGNGVVLPAIPFGKVIKWTLLALIILGIGVFLLTPPAPVTADNASAVSDSLEEETSALDDKGNIKTGIPVDVDSLFQQPQSEEE